VSPPAVVVRTPREADIPPLTDIYNHYVRTSHATFDERETTLDERRTWYAKYKETGPHRLFVAEIDGQVGGGATSNPYREHPAFRDTIETGIYLAHDVRGRGVGTALYAHLFEALRGEKLHRAVAAIALPNPASVALHERFGFRKVGVFDGYAVKHGERISSVWLEKALDAAF
jgi:phosphinothricin acetyltransferase